MSVRTSLLWALPLALPVLALPPLSSSPAGRGLSAVDNQLEVLAFQLRGPQPAPEEVVILAIDGPSLTPAQLLTAEERQASPLWRDTGPWPRPRALQAELAVRLLGRCARQVVLGAGGGLDRREALARPGPGQLASSRWGGALVPRPQQSARQGPDPCGLRTGAPQRPPPAPLTLDAPGQGQAEQRLSGCEACGSGGGVCETS